MKRWKKICAIVTCCMLVSGCSGTGVSTDTAGVEEQTENTVSQGNDANEPDSTDDTQNQNDTQSSQNDDLGIRRGDGNGKGGGRNGGGRGGNRGDMGSQNDEEIQSILDENAGKFRQFEYIDSESGTTLEYSLYIPEDYDANNKYPLLMYIPDATGSGKSAKEIVEQYYGAAVWVTDEDQEKHPSFVMVPAFTETVTDDNWNISNQVETAVKLVGELQTEYSIDYNRIYTTGQSMGCMTSLYLNSTYPDLFAASMYVSGQWDISVLKEMENQKFFYITAGGDEKASGGQSEVMAMFDADGVSYSYGEWNAQNSYDEQTSAVNALIAEGNSANMIRFEAGTVFKDGESGMEHMVSFNYAYKLNAVRDWLFEQSK